MATLAIMLPRTIARAKNERILKFFESEYFHFNLKLFTVCKHTGMIKEEERKGREGIHNNIPLHPTHSPTKQWAIIDIQYL